MPKEVDVITFPLFAFFNPVMRVTSVFPKIDFTRPARADPIILCHALQSNKATHMFGSPALLDRLSRYGVRRSIKLSTIRRILIAGAPVSTTILARLYELIGPDAEVYSCYGATEALPVCVLFRAGSFSLSLCLIRSAVFA
jgi:acyl-coenzyme A synthetase/AMP-(fatty) acid ligase